MKNLLLYTIVWCSFMFCNEILCQKPGNSINAYFTLIGSDLNPKNSVTKQNANYFKIHPTKYHCFSIGYKVFLNEKFFLRPLIGYSRVKFVFENSVYNPINEDELVFHLDRYIRYDKINLGFGVGIKLNKFEALGGITLNNSLNNSSNFNDNYGAIFTYFDFENNNSTIFEVNELNRAFLIEDYFLTYNAEINFRAFKRIQFTLGLTSKTSKNSPIYSFDLHGNTSLNGVNSTYHEQVNLFPKWNALYLGIGVEISN